MMRAPNQNSIATRVMDHAFAGIVSIWPADSRDWARAMHAEFEQTNNAGEKLNWLLGGAMSLTSAWTQRLAFGPRKTREAAAPKPVKKPGALAFVLMALALASLALPGMWQGIVTISETWAPQHTGISQDRLLKMGAAAEQEHDAKMLAFVAMRARSTEALHYADAAAAIDPATSWVYFEIRHRWPFQINSPLDLSADRLKRLQMVDPDNAVPYLAEAEQYFRAYEPSFDGAHLDRAAQEMSKNSAWLTAMDRAFRASKFDDYARKRMELNLAVMREHNIERPIDLMYANAATPIPDAYNISVYSALLLSEAESRAAAGDIATARKTYDEILAFSQRIRVSNEAPFIENILALERARKGLISEQKTFERAGRNDEAKMASVALAEVEAQRVAYRASNYREWTEVKLTIPSVMFIHLSILCVIVSCGLLLFALVGLVVCRRFPTTSVNTPYRIVRFAPPVLAASLALFYASYLPYRNAFWTATPQGVAAVSWQFGALLASPFSWISPFHGYGTVYFWTAVLILCASMVTVMVLRPLARTIARRVEA